MMCLQHISETLVLRWWCGSSRVCGGAEWRVGTTSELRLCSMWGYVHWSMGFGGP